MEKLMDELEDKNRTVMKRTIEIFPVELTRHANFGNYFFKYGAFTFELNAKMCDILHNTLVKGFG